MARKGVDAGRVAAAVPLRRRARQADHATTKLERIDALAIPPAWKDVWISPRPRAKLQATGVDAAGRQQYLYHPDFRAPQEQAKYDKLIRFAERLPAFREAMAEHMELEPTRLRNGRVRSRSG